MTLPQQLPARIAAQGRRRGEAARLLLVIAIIAVVSGCKSHPERKSATQPAVTPIERQTLGEIEPQLQLPVPATRPAGHAPPRALQLYAQARDALLSNRKQQAIEKLNAALEIDPHSAVLHRDLGVASLGVNNDRAMASYRKAIEIDPGDVDSRLQVARLLLAGGDADAALTQLRLARLTDSYDPASPDAAVVNLLLGRLLQDRGYSTAALEAYEQVLPVIEKRSIELRARPELAELIAKPSILRLRIADLASSIGQYDRAMKLYALIQRDEPSVAPGIELRIIQTLARKGEIEQASRQMLEIVDRFEASRSSLQAYVDLFSERGADPAALEAAESAPPGRGTYTHRSVLRARLLRQLGKPEAAIQILQSDQPTLAYVRELVMAHRDAGRSDELPRALMRMMVDHPRQMDEILRGWAILTNTIQPHPLQLAALREMKVPDDLEAARRAMVARLAAERGQPVAAREAMQEVVRLDPARAALWSQPARLDQLPDVDVTSERDLALFIDEFSNDPQYLNLTLQLLIRQGQTPRIIEALEAALQRRPGNLAALAPLVSLLNTEDRKAEAVHLIESAVEKAGSGPELYELAAQAGALGETELSERLLRLSHQADPDYPPTCNDLGYLLADSNRELDFAERLLLRAVAAEPESPAYVDSLGWLLYKRGKYADASKYLELAVAVSEPADPIVLDHAADAAYRIGDKALAQQHWKQALDQISKQPPSDPQLRLRVEHKLRQMMVGEPVDVAP